MKKFLAALLFFPALAFCQGGTPQFGPIITTVAGLGAYAIKGNHASVTDGNSGTDCTVGGGTTVVVCQYSGSSWSAISSSGAFPRLDQVLDPNTAKTFSMGTNNLTFTGSGEYQILPAFVQGNYDSEVTSFTGITISANPISNGSTSQLGVALKTTDTGLGASTTIKSGDFVLFDNRVSGQVDQLESLHAESFVNGNANVNELRAFGAFANSYGSGTIGSINSAVFYVENDAAHVTGNMAAIRIEQPTNSGTVDGSVIGLRIDDQPAGGYAIQTAAGLNSFGGNVSAPSYSTATNCASAASPAVCGSAAAGHFVIAADGTSVTVNTTAVTANSEIVITEDQSVGTLLSVTCNTGISSQPVVSDRTAGTSFTVTISAGLATNPVCYGYQIIN